MDQANNINSIMPLLIAQQRICREITKRIMPNLRSLTAETQNTSEEHNSPASPISNNYVESTICEATKEIPLERSIEPELSPKPQHCSFFDEIPSPLFNSNNNSVVEDPVFNNNIFVITDKNERGIVPLEEPPTPFTMKFIFSPNDFFKADPDHFYSEEQIINNFKWVLKINFREAIKYKYRTIPLILGIFLQCKGPIEGNNQQRCNVKELTFKVLNWNQGTPALAKTKVCQIPFEPPFAMTNGVWFKFDGKKVLFLIS
uniref:MATH domain-containing protein n=1 Tax=Meloidogyne hapla TaxID=6305 RepID=A0A1I8B7Z2_MELHA